MMKKKSKIVISISCCIIIAIVSVCYFYQYNKINTMYPSPKTIEYTIGDSVILNGLELNAKSLKIYSLNELQQKYSINQASIQKPSGDYKIILVEIIIKNTTNVAKQASTYEYTLQSKSWSNGLDSEVFSYVNAGGLDEAPIIKPNETVSMVLPYSIYEAQFQKKEWVNITKRDFSLVLSMYPVMNCITLN